MTRRIFLAQILGVMVAVVWVGVVYLFGGIENEGD